MGDDFQPGHLADWFVAGRSQPGIAKQVAPQRNPGNKVQKARNTRSAKSKLQVVHQYSEKECVLHLEFDCKSTCHTQRFHPAKQLDGTSYFIFQSMSTKLEPAHITQNFLRRIQRKIPRQAPGACRFDERCVQKEYHRNKKGSKSSLVGSKFIVTINGCFLWDPLTQLLSKFLTICTSSLH
eukprot:1140570-Pelagomonas_calceolata.AAC.1